jgi:DNA-binding IscR family transcriptional regulator
MVTVQSLAIELNVRTSELEPIVRRLEEAGLITEVRQDHAGKNQGLLLTADPARISIPETLRTVEAGGLDLTGEDKITMLIKRLEECETKGLDSMSLRDLENADSKGDIQPRGAEHPTSCGKLGKPDRNDVTFSPVRDRGQF